MAKEPGAVLAGDGAGAGRGAAGGERGQLIASTASARGKITETELQILQIDGDMRTEVGKDLAEIRGKWSELVEKRVAAEDQLKRIDCARPRTGRCTSSPCTRSGAW